MKSKLYEIIILTAAYYGHTLQDEVVRMYAQDLEDLSIQAILDAYTAYRKDPKNTRPPLPAQIRAIAKPLFTDDGQSKEAAARIIAAVTRFGYPNPDEAREYIGELGWQVVRLQGGWAEVCQSMTDSKKPILQAQYRELAKSQIERAKAGVGDHPPGLPTPPSNQQALAQVLELARPKTLDTLSKVETER